MEVYVKLFASLRRLRPGLEIGQAFPVELAEGATTGQLVQQLGLPADEVKIVFVNAIARPAEHILAAGDQVGIFPPVGGG
jgi:molybdopterin converting factor small subunit